MYETLFCLADLPGCPDIREQAVKVLQLLPTCPTIPERLRQSMAHDIGMSKIIMEHAQAMHQPARLLYSLQVSPVLQSYIFTSLV